MGMTIRGEGAGELASVASWYTFMVEKLGVTSKEASILIENVISAIELNSPRAAKFPELFVCLDAQWRHFGQKRKLLDEWLTKMARDPLYWPLRLPVRGSRVGDQILKALRTGRKTDVQIVRAFPKSAKMTLTKLSPTLGLAIKAGKIIRVSWGEYALPESGLAAYISPSRLLVELVIGAPDYPPAEDALVAAMRARGHTEDGTYHSLRWLRENGVLAPRRDGRVPLSAESLAKRERGEELRDGRGAVLWAPPLVVPAEVATWESRLIDASGGGTPDPGDAVPAREQGKAVPPSAVSRRTERRAIKQAALEKSVQRYIELILAYPDGAPEPREILAQKMMNDFGVTWHEARDCRGDAIKRTGNLNWGRRGRPAGDRRSKSVQESVQESVQKKGV
jgi:hypothetical protein